MAETNRKTIPIIYQDFEEMIDRDFSDLRKRFNDEIHKVEEELAKFRSELLNKNGNFFKSCLSKKKTGKTLKPIIENKAKQDGICDLSPPEIEEDGKRKVLKLRFKVSNFKPEEVVLSATDDKLSVQAKHKDKLPDKNVYNESQREVPLPKGVNPESIRSTLSRDGVLTVNAPLPNANVVQIP